MANRRFIDFPIASTSGDTDIILIWQDGANKQTTKATFLSGLPENLEDLNDVAISGLTNGQILRYDSVTGKWENTDQGNLDLNDLNDVSIVSPSNGQVLVYNSSTSKWENSSAGFVPYTGAVTTVNLGAQTIQAGQFVKAGGTSAQFLKADGSVDSNTYGTGTVTSVALTMPAAFSVANSPVTTAGTLAVTGAGNASQYIAGDGTLVSFPSLTGYVPYTGANQTVNLNTQLLQAGHTTLTTNGSTETLTINHTSGSGKAINVTKGGAGEGLYVNKTSGSGNAATIVGTLEATTLVKTGGTSSQFLKADGSVDSTTYGTGTVTSVGLSSATSGVTIGSTPVTTSGTITLAIATASGSQNGLLSSTDWTTFNSKQNALTNPVTGTGTTNYLPKFTGSTTIGDSALQETNGNLGLGVTPPAWAAFKAINIGGASVSANSSASIILSRNWYYDGGERYFENGTAQRLELVANGFFFQTATTNSSGAGAALTWGNPMTLTSSGRLLINQPTESTFHLDVVGTSRISGAATFSSSVTANQISSVVTSGTARVTIGDDLISGGSLLNLRGVSGGKTWFVANNYNVGGALEFIQSTTNGGTTPASSAAMLITSGGNVLIGTTSVIGVNTMLSILTGVEREGLVIKLAATNSYSPIWIRNSSDVAMFYVNEANVGYLNAAAWSYGSDKRLKENIAYIETGINKVMALKPATFDYINGVKNNIGWIAQDVQEVIPEAVGTISKTNDQLTLKSDFIIPYLVKAIQELKQEIDTLKS